MCGSILNAKAHLVRSRQVNGSHVHTKRIVLWNIGHDAAGERIVQAVCARIEVFNFRDVRRRVGGHDKHGIERLRQCDIGIELQKHLAIQRDCVRRRIDSLRKASGLGLGRTNDSRRAIVGPRQLVRHIDILRRRRKRLRSHDIRRRRQALHLICGPRWRMSNKEPK